MMNDLRVGFCRLGPAHGCFLVAAALGPATRVTNGSVTESPVWDIYFSAPVELDGDLADDPFTIPDDELRESCDAWGVVWAPDDRVAAAVVAALFPQLTIGRAPADSVASAEQNGGKTRGWRGFEQVARGIASSMPVLEAFVAREQSQARAEVLESPDTRRVIDELSLALEAHGYCVAVLPLRESDDSDPWESFR